MNHAPRFIGPACLVLVIGASGCGTDLGGGAGLETKTAHAVGFGRVAASTKLGTPLNDQGLLVGASLESRAEQDEGSRWDTGVMLGWGTGPAAIDGVVGFEAFGEFGTPIHETLFRRGDFYTGGVLAVPLHFGKRRHLEDLNKSTWVLTQRFEFVPFGRGRVHVDHPEGDPAQTRIDVAMGLALRMRIFSDLF